MIDIKDLHFRYPQKSEDTIKGINFNVENGEIFGFLGPSGAGKSTTQKIIIGILRNYTGNACVFGKEIFEHSKDYYEDIGVAFELPNLYNKFTALENLKYFSSFYSDSTDNPELLLEMVYLKDDADVKVENFSKGMKMRLNFARSLLNKPKLLFLDEPTSGLDPVNARNIMNIVKDLSENGTTIFLTTHNMTVADELCNRVAFITEGQLRLIDSPVNLKLKYGKKTVRIEHVKNNQDISDDFDMDNLARNDLFLEILNNNQIKRIHSQEATLEDIFIKCTGKELG